ncbi:Glycosyltransferase involved in cell wall bisynthesis [Pedobacter suwonensis]|uniref:Glycosyltransferase involved in cell wall bisynthesis n=1 Tax=Pedobacter suwonensis TaxID=332999 RepID=A0A1I0U8L6_9SPHI|nr:glycosyltransferase family 4 protein [Pedobacter suwonensis]SFA60408.1 Glycosyltransferase involved in cell wall bisynthesis [Pedobacter suwonensis]
MKILTVTHLSTLYGANRSLLNLIQGTKGTLDWIVICRGYKYENPSLKSELKEMGVKCYNIPYRLDVHARSSKLIKTKAFFVLEFIYNFIIASMIAVFAILNRVKIIHSNSSCMCLGAYISFIIRKPHVWHFREFLYDDYRLEYNFGVKYLRYWANKSFKIIAISKAIHQACIVDRNISANTTILYNGVVHEKDVTTVSLVKMKPPVRLLIMGVLDETKNQIDAIKAVDLLISEGYEIVLNVAGGKSGPYFNFLEDYVYSRNLQDSVVFTGYIPSPRKLFEESDIVLVCSKNEGMGRVTLESMAFGTPVIGYDAAGTSELINHMENGLLYLGDFESLADKILMLIKDPSLYHSLLIGGQKSILTKYTVEKYAENFLSNLPRRGD